MPFVKKTFLSPVLLCVLAGCFDSSGSGSDPSEPEFSEREEAETFRTLTPVSLDDEAGALERPVTDSAQAEQGQKLVTDEPQSLEVAWSEGVMVLTPQPVDRPVTALVALVDGQGRKLFEFRVNLANQAGKPLTERADAWMAARESVRALEEDCVLVQAVATAGYLGEALTFPDYDQQSEELTLPFTGEAPELAEAFRALQRSREAYRQGGLGMEALEQDLDTLRRAAHDHQREHADAAVRTAHDAVPAWEPPPERRLRYHRGTGALSSLRGNEAVGSATGDGWTFNEAWAQLAAVVVADSLPECEGGGL